MDLYFNQECMQFDGALADQMIQAAHHSLKSAGFVMVGPEKVISDLDSAHVAIVMAWKCSRMPSIILITTWG
jgi:hypothetical protein